MYDMYRRLALAKYEERYVIPSAYVNQGHQLEETATECVLSFDGDRECTSRVHSARPAADRCSATLPRAWLRSLIAGAHPWPRTTIQLCDGVIHSDV